MAFIADVRADVQMVRTHRGRVLPHLFPVVLAAFTYRSGAALRTAGFTRTARAVSALGQALTGAEIDPQAVIGPGLFVEHTVGVVVGPGVVAGARLRLFGGALLGSTFNAQDSKRPHHGFPTLGDDVLVLAKASVLGPVTVGDEAVIAAHALVLDDVPSRYLARGVPAKSYTRE